MNYEIIKNIENIFQIPPEIQQSVQKHRYEIQSILSGQDNRLIIIVGPCSAWPKEAVIDYAKKLKAIIPLVEHKIKIIMRLFPHKSRTTIGWPGPIYQSNVLSPMDIESGFKYTQEMLQTIGSMNIPLASEAINTHFYEDYWKWFSWLAIGARSSESPEHRIFASLLDMPVGLKNPTHGDIKTAINSVIAAQHSHVTFFKNQQIKTTGNPYAHLVLRGNNKQSNYNFENIEFIDALFQKYNIKNPSLLIDVSHGNSIINGIKDYQSQPQTILNLFKKYQKNNKINKLVKGFMLESFIESGKQDIFDANTLNYNGLSITDACIDWKSTENLLLQLVN